MVGLGVGLALACTPANDSSDDSDAPIDEDESSASSSTPESESDSESDTEAPDPPSGEIPVPPPSRPGIPDEVTGRLFELEGQLAVGSGPQLAVTRPDGASFRLLGSEREIAVQPTWSRDGTSLAWSAASAERQAVLIQSFDEQGVPLDDPVASDAPGPPVFYLQWSLEDDRLAYLRSAVGGAGVEFGVFAPEEPLEAIETGQPFYVAWGEDVVLTHTNDLELGLFDLAAQARGVTELVAETGRFTAPAWVDAERAVAVVDDELVLVTITDGAVEATEPLAAIDGAARFVVSPDGSRVAYQEIDLPGDEPLLAGLAVVPDPDEEDPESPDPADPDSPDGLEEAGLIVLEIATGETEVVTGAEVLAWEWSPDGSRLAWLDSAVANRPIGRWHFWAVDGAELGSAETPEHFFSRTYAQAYLPFFDQYAQSVTGWAPDSSAFAFAGIIDEEPGIYVQLLEIEADAVWVAPGDFVTWGPGPTPPPVVSGASPA